MAQLLEDIYPPVQSVGLNTNKVVNFGNKVVGQQQNVVSIVAGASTATLTVASSASLVLLSCTSGTVVNLPAPVVGTTYQFVVTSALAAGTHKIITNASTASLIGAVYASGIIAGNTVSTFTSFGTTANIAIAMNGTTTGGTNGTNLNFTAVSSTQWLVEGTIIGSGLLATPFATS